MNWTEGKLARHSRRRQSKQTALRQKEYFAKARAGLLPSASRQIPPPCPFPAAVFSHPRISPTSTRPVHDRAPGGDRGRLSTDQGQHLLSSSPRSRQPHSNEASPYHFRPPLCSPYDFGPVPALVMDESEIRRKRQKLLSDQDWAGVRIQKPIPVRFEEVRSDDRKWTMRMRSKASNQRHLTLGGHDQKKNTAENLALIGGDLARNQRSRGIHITVGSQEMRLGQGSSIRQSDHLLIAPYAGHEYLAVAPMPKTVIPGSSSITDQRLDHQTYGHQDRHAGQPSLSSIPEELTIRNDRDEPLGQPQLIAPEPKRPVRWLPPLPTMSSFDNDIRNSTLAAVGEPQSSMSESGVKQNEAWWRFVDATRTETTFLQSPPVRISPGVSARHHHLVQEITSSNNLTKPSATDTTGSHSIGPGLVHVSHLDSRQLAGVSASTNEPNLSYPTTDASLQNRRTSACDSARSISVTGSETDQGPETTLRVPEYLQEHSYNGSRGNEAPNGLFNASTSPSLETPASHSLEGSQRPSIDGASASYFREFDPAYDDDSSSVTDADMQSADQRIAGLREAALKLISGNGRTAWGVREEEGGDKVTRSPRNSHAAINSPPHRSRQHTSQESPPEVSAGAAATETSRGLSPSQEQHSKTPQPTGELLRQDGHAKDGPSQPPPRTEAPQEEPQDIWFRYLFSDTNTDELHQQVLDEGAKETARMLLRGAGIEDSQRIPESERGHNISTAATLSSLDAVSVSHNAAIGSPAGTQTAGTVYEGWDGSGGPPYAAPSIQGLMSSGTTTLPLTGQAQDQDSGIPSHGAGQGVSTTTSGFSSNAAEPPHSVADHPSAKESFRFAPPKLFVGKLSDSVPAERPVVAVKPVTMTTPKRGRPKKKKARDGRANIKNIPVYNDDPIEDFESSSPQARVVPSLFGALDTE